MRSTGEEKKFSLSNSLFGFMKIVRYADTFLFAGWDADATELHKIVFAVHIMNFLIMQLKGWKRLQDGIAYSIVSLFY